MLKWCNNTCVLNIICIVILYFYDISDSHAHFEDFSLKQIYYSYKNLLYKHIYLKAYLDLQALEEEESMTPEQLAIKNVGKQVKLVLITL